METHKAENHDFIIVVKAPTPYCIWFFVGSNVQEDATSNFCKLQHARKLQLPCFFYKLPPTGGSYLSQLQLNILARHNLKGDHNPLTQHEKNKLIYPVINSTYLHLYFCLFSLEICFIFAPYVHNISINSLILSNSLTSLMPSKITFFIRIIF